MSFPIEAYMTAGVPEVAARSLFIKYDVNNDGSLGREELHTLLVDDLGLKKDQTEAFFLVVDTDGNGTISFPEFWEHIESGKLSIDTLRDCSRFFLLERAIQLFKEVDDDKSGYLEKPELEQLRDELYPEDPKPDWESLMALDTDGDGKISMHEFLKWLNWVPI